MEEVIGSIPIRSTNLKSFRFKVYAASGSAGGWPLLAYRNLSGVSWPYAPRLEEAIANTTGLIGLPPLQTEAGLIVVVEGISAAGKSTWCRNYSKHIVPETGRLSNIPDRNVDPLGAAQFWAGQNAARWSDALVQERSSGLAVCDNDPLKLHYIWTLWQIGEAPEDHWNRELDASRQLIQERKIGFADLYLVKKIDPAKARQQRDADSTRTRHNFELHIRLQEPLMRWYEAFQAVLPQPVLFELPETDSMPTSSVFRASRYAPELFEEIIANLNRI